MAQKMFYINLSKESVNACVKWLEEYKKSLTSKTNEFVTKLAEIGVEYAEQNNVHVPGPTGTHNMDELVYFTKKVEPKKYGCDALVIGTGKTFISTWDNGEKSETVYPMHYLEYGTSHNGMMKWCFVDNDGNIFDRATGIKATQPMYKAFTQMRLEILDIAKEVYGK